MQEVSLAALENVEQNENMQVIEPLAEPVLNEEELAILADDPDADKDPEIVDAESNHGQNDESQVIPPVEEPEPETTVYYELGKLGIHYQLEELKRKIEEMKNLASGATTTKGPKNQVPGKPSAGRKYVILSKSLAAWGKVPTQQKEVADLILKYLPVGQEIPETTLFDTLQEHAHEFTSLARSRQDPTYLFRYYRGLKNEGKHAGYIARNFIQQIG